jgi:aminoglycoside phosphotransferase (APT) family kinase protein
VSFDPKEHPTEEWIAGLRARFPTERYVDRALTRKLRARTNPAYHPQTVDGVAERLRLFLEREIQGPFSVSNIGALTGGASKEQFSFHLRWQDADGSPRSERLVLRITPGASAAETHRLREFQLMGALQGALPVPSPRWIDPEGEIFGQPCLICSFCDGVTKPSGGAVSGMRTSFGPDHRKALAPQFIRHLANLANVDWRKHDMSAFDAPQPGTREGVIQQLNWWERVWAEDSVAAEPLLTLVGRWLRENAPPVDKVSIVHGDYRAGNFLFSPTTIQISAILDWELAFLGDRHADLAYVIDPLFSERGETGELLVCGLCTREVFLDEYAKCSGMPIDPDRLRYYEILMGWRNSVIALGGGSRCAVGQTSHQDVMFAWLVPGVAPISMGALRELVKDLF